MNELAAQELVRRTEWSCPLFNVVFVEVKTGNPSPEIRWIVERPDTVTVLAIRGDDAVLAARQVRSGSTTVEWRLPTGRVEPNEESEQVARRELFEEAGIPCESSNLVEQTTGRSGGQGKKRPTSLQRGMAQDGKTDKLERLDMTWLSLAELRGVVYGFSFSPHISRALVFYALSDEDPADRTAS